MNKAYINSLTIYITVVCASITAFLFFNSSKVLIAKMLFAPFLLDISRGVGDVVALWFRGLSSVTLIVMTIFVVLRCRATSKTQQYLLSFAGIVATTIHFGLVSLGYITTRLH